MRLLFLLIALCVSHLASATALQDRSLKRESVQELAESLGLSPDANLVEQTQSKWLRKPHQERWEIQELSLDQKKYVLQWAECQGFFSECAPYDTVYDKALILGATTGCMQKRLSYLVELWNRGVRFNEVVWLTGERPLDANIDTLLEECHNESEAAILIWQKAQLPSDMRNLPVVFVSVPMKQTGKRPNTQDTVIAWLESDSTPCKALFVSDQPFCGYQFAIIKSTLPETYTFDVVGPAVNPLSHPASAAITLDSIARQLYQERLSDRVVLK